MPINSSNINIIIKYKVKDIVFATVRCSYIWPAKIEKWIQQPLMKHVDKYNVTFFGTGESATLSSSELCKYRDNQNEYQVETVAQRHKETFSKALNEIDFEYNSAENKLS